MKLFLQVTRLSGLITPTNNMKFILGTNVVTCQNDFLKLNDKSVIDGQQLNSCIEDI